MLLAGSRATGRRLDATAAPTPAPSPAPASEQQATQDCGSEKPAMPRTGASRQRHHGSCQCACVQAVTITITSPCPQSTINELGIRQWPIWSCEPSTFPWTYDEQETCLLVEGDVTVTPDGGEPVRFGAGDLVVFPAGLSCTWEVHQAVRKHYRFG